MDYKEKYEQALERMKSWAKGEHPECFSEAQKAAEFIFPELKESEGERIRKKLICFVENWKNFRPNSPFDDYAVYTSDRDECDRILAWLEKQGEKLNPELEEKNEKIRKGLIKAFRTVGKSKWGGLNVRDILTWLENQGEQNTLNADEVIEWLKTEWEDLGINWVRGVYADEIIDKFKKDFGL